MKDLTIQDNLSSTVYALNDEDAKLVLGIVDRILADYDLPELTPEEEAELDRLEVEDTEPGVPIEVLLEKYGVAV